MTICDKIRIFSKLADLRILPNSLVNLDLFQICSISTARSFSKGLHRKLNGCALMIRKFLYTVKLAINNGLQAPTMPPFLHLNVCKRWSSVPFRPNEFSCVSPLFKALTNDVDFIVFPAQYTFCKFLLKVEIFPPHRQYVFFAYLPPDFVGVVMTHQAEVGVDRSSHLFKHPDPNGMSRSLLVKVHHR